MDYEHRMWKKKKKCLLWPVHQFTCLLGNCNDLSVQTLSSHGIHLEWKQKCTYQYIIVEQNQVA